MICLNCAEDRKLLTSTKICEGCCNEWADNPLLCFGKGLADPNDKVCYNCQELMMCVVWPKSEVEFNFLEREKLVMSTKSKKATATKTKKAAKVKNPAAAKVKTELSWRAGSSAQIIADTLSSGRVSISEAVEKLKEAGVKSKNLMGRVKTIAHVLVHGGVVQREGRGDSVVFVKK